MNLLSSDRRLTMVLGSIRSGKTVTLAIAFVEFARRFPPGTEFLVGGHSIGAAVRNVATPMERQLRGHGVEYQFVRGGTTPHLLIDGKVLWFVGGANANDSDRIQGMTAGGALLDEAPLLHPDFLAQASARCSLPGSKIVHSGNKTSAYHPYKLDWWDRSEELNAETWEFTLQDAWWLDDQTRLGWEREIGGHLYQRWVANEFADPEGLVYPNPPRVHGPTEYTGQQVLGVDYGPAGTTAGVLLAERVGGGWDAVDEYYWDANKMGIIKSAEEQAGEMRRQFPFVDRIAVDPSGVALREAMVKAGFAPLTTKNEVLLGIQSVQAAFHTGKLRIGELRQTLREAATYAWAAPTRDGIEKPIKKSDHSLDALRYAVVAVMPVQDKRFWVDYHF